MPADPRTVFPTATFHGAGPPLLYTVRRSARARHPSLWVAPHAGVVVTCSLTDEEASITRMLARHERWIRRQVARASLVQAPRRWPYGPTLPYAGEEHEVTVVAAPRASVVRTPGRLAVLVRTPTIERAQRVLKHWYRDQARQAVTAAVEAWGARLGLTWTRIRIGDQRSRWGSCSATGALSFNYRLVMMPQEILSYVVLHELLHRRVLNHSPAFWRAVEAHVPDYAASRRWLRRSGASYIL